MSSLRAYLDELEAKLVRAGQGVHVAAEIEAHLEDAIDALRASGIDEATATRTAIERLGSVDHIVSAFATTEKGTIMLRMLVTLLAIVNTTFAMLIATANLWHPTDRPGYLALLVCSVVVAHSVLLFVRPTSPPWSDIHLVASLLLVALGSAAVIWTIHLGRVTGDFEYWAIGFATCCGAQGMLTAWTLWSTTRPHVSMS